MSAYDYLRESFSYFGLFRKTRGVKKVFSPEYVSYGRDKDQYFLYYEPAAPVSEAVIYWVHGGAVS